MPPEGNLSAFGDQTNQFCSGHFREPKLQKSLEKKCSTKWSGMKLMPQTLHGHVLHETADAKKQQAGQQLVHEAPQWVGAQWSGWVVVARTRGGQNHATEHDKRTQRSASWLPFCHVSRAQDSERPGLLDNFKNAAAVQWASTSSSPSEHYPSKYSPFCHPLSSSAW